MTDWVDVGAVDELQKRPLQHIRTGGLDIALTCVNGVFRALKNQCTHYGGPLAEGRLEGEILVCPWHGWGFDRNTGEMPRIGARAGCVATYAVRIENGRVLVSVDAATPQKPKNFPANPLARDPVRQAGPTRVLGISTTVTSSAPGRISGSRLILEKALAIVAAEGVETRQINLEDLKIEPCQGYYSISAHACTFPCTITNRDKTDQMALVYDALIHWADVIVIATPIRWGRASALYYRMVERLNAVQNQMTIADRNLILPHKTACHIIIGGQDNIQSVAGDLLGFWSELGFNHPPSAFVGHSRGWTAEDMESNVRDIVRSTDLVEETTDMIWRAAGLAEALLARPARV
ncbi:MAG: Rieske 2Fe-2S domain-containing protein [Proteobacteria bacterium]|nr:Rieske 2Fe-2S domain-containing protein [Pseudomonadota bacterium]